MAAIGHFMTYRFLTSPRFCCDQIDPSRDLDSNLKDCRKTVLICPATNDVRVTGRGASLPYDSIPARQMYLMAI